MKIRLALAALALAAAACSAPVGSDADESNQNLGGEAVSAGERKAIINALRAGVRPDLANQDILFNFSEGSFRSAGDYAFVMGTIQLHDGREPSTAGTIYEEDARSGLFDGFRVEALLAKEGGVWKLKEHGIGSTDVWYDGIESRYPRAPRSIFPWLDGQSLEEVAQSERMAIMSGLRKVVKPELGNQDIVFNVRNGAFNVSGGYVWLAGHIELRGGGVPTTAGTTYADEQEEGIFDGFHVEALLEKEGSEWKVLAHAVGSTDVWYTGIADRFPDAPKAIFPPEAASQ